MTSSKLVIRVHPSVQNDARARSWEHRYSWSKIVQQLFTTSDFAMKNGLQERRIEHTIWTAPALISSSCCCALWWSSSSVARWSFSSRWESSFARVASVGRGEITKTTFSMMCGMKVQICIPLSGDLPSNVINLVFSRCFTIEGKYPIILQRAVILFKYLVANYVLLL